MSSLKKRIEEDYKTWMLSPEQTEQYKLEVTSIEGRFNAFKAAALPLHEEIQELRGALELVTNQFSLDISRNSIKKQIRAKFKLDEVKK